MARFSDDSRGRAASKSAPKKVVDDSDPWGDDSDILDTVNAPRQKAGKKFEVAEDEEFDDFDSKKPQKKVALDDLLNSSDDEKPKKGAKTATPAKATPAKATPAKAAAVNPIAAAAAAAVAARSKGGAKPTASVEKVSSAVAASKPVLYSSEDDDDNMKTLEPDEDPFGDPKEQMFSDIEEDDDAIAARFLAEKKQKQQQQQQPQPVQKPQAKAAPASSSSSAAAKKQEEARKQKEAEEKAKREAEEQAKLREEMYKKQEEEIEWMSGEECEAMWTEDNNWYRALIIAGEPDGTFTVEFVEYGNMQEGTPTTLMRRIGDIEQDVPSDDDQSARKNEAPPKKQARSPSPGTEEDDEENKAGDDEEEDLEEASPLPQPKTVPTPRVNVPALKLVKVANKNVDTEDEENSDNGAMQEEEEEEKQPPKKTPVKAVEKPKTPKTAAAAPAKAVKQTAAPVKATPPPATKVPTKAPANKALVIEPKALEESTSQSQLDTDVDENENELDETFVMKNDKKSLQQPQTPKQKQQQQKQQLDDDEFDEMAELLHGGPDENVDIAQMDDRPDLKELEMLFEDDPFLDFVPDGSTLAPSGYDEPVDEADASAIFGIFDADDMMGGVPGPKDAFLRFSLNREGMDALDLLHDFVALREAAGLDPIGTELDPRTVRKTIRAAIEKEMDFKSPKLGIFKLLDKQSKRPDVLACGEAMAKSLRVLVVGAGIAGLRIACELALLGVRVVVIERRTSFSRNNVLHLWSHVVADVQALGAAFWVPGFCKGNIHHCPIRKLQLCLLRTALLLGVDVFLGCAFEGVYRKNGEWRAKCDHVVVSDYGFNVLVGGDGESSRVANFMGFDKKETAYSLALGITANFENSKTKSQLSAKEVNVARHFKQEWFAKLAREKKIELENMVYYQDDTHYFVCTAMKDSLLTKGVFKEDVPELTNPSNVNRQMLQQWCEEVAAYAGLPKSAQLCKVVRADGQTQVDTAIFDFSRKFRAVTPMRVFSGSDGSLLWTFVVGDALMEPFWPLGTGANRAVLSAWDTMAILVQVGMTGLLSADTCGDLQPIFEASMSMYQALQASDPNTMKPEKFRMPGEPAPLYSYDPSSRYPRMTSNGIPDGEGEVIDWESFTPGCGRVINTMSKADSSAKKRPSNPFKPGGEGVPAKASPQVSKANPAVSKAPPAAAASGPKKVSAQVSQTAPPKKVPAKSVTPPPVAEPAPEADLVRESVAPPTFAAPVPGGPDISRESMAPPSFSAPAPGQDDTISRESMAPPSFAAPAPAPAKAVSPPVVKAQPKETTAKTPAKAPAKTSVAAPATSGGSAAQLNKNPKAAISAVAANDASFDVMDMSGNTTFAFKHRELVKELAQALQANTVLKELHLKQCDLDKTDVQELCTALVQNTSLLVLDLEKNKIDNDGAALLANALRSNYSIRELNLLGQAGRAFGDACLQSFIDMFDYNVTLTKIVWRLDSRKSFAINKLLVRNNTIFKNLSQNRDVTSLIPGKCNVPDLMALRGSSSTPALAEDDVDGAEPLEEDLQPEETEPSAVAASGENVEENVDPEPDVAEPTNEDPDDDEYCATVDLNVFVPPKVTKSPLPAVTPPAAVKKSVPSLPLKQQPVVKKEPPKPSFSDADLGDLEDDLYDEPQLSPKPAQPAKTAPAKPIPPVKASSPRPRESDEAPIDEEDDDYIATVDLNAVVPAKKPMPVLPAKTATTTPAPSVSPKAPPAKAAVPPRLSAAEPGTRLRGMSGRGNKLPVPKSVAPGRGAAAPPSLTQRLAETRAKTQAKIASTTRESGTGPAVPAVPKGRGTPDLARRPSVPQPRRSTETSKAAAAAAPVPAAVDRNDPLAAARAAVAAVTGDANALSKVNLTPSMEVKQDLSVPSPNGAPPDAHECYEDLSRVVDRWNSMPDQEVVDGGGQVIIQELARIRDKMLPLHNKYKTQGYMMGAVAKWRSMNDQVPKKINSLK